MVVTNPKSNIKARILNVCFIAELIVESNI
jgi:hypothetical protein